MSRDITLVPLAEQLANEQFSLKLAKLLGAVVPLDAHSEGPSSDSSPWP